MTRLEHITQHRTGRAHILSPSRTSSFSHVATDKCCLGQRITRPFLLFQTEVFKLGQDIKDLEAILTNLPEEDVDSQLAITR